MTQFLTGRVLTDGVHYTTRQFAVFSMTSTILFRNKYRKMTWVLPFTSLTYALSSIFQRTIQPVNRTYAKREVHFQRSDKTK